jgi:DNA-3-methyladenine glycosylase
MPRHPSGSLIPAAFYRRPAHIVAPDLLGRHLVAGDVTLRITEVEAYGGPEDSASHCRFGRTARNAPMWGPGGHAYLYLCYGLHWMLNVVTGPAGEGGAVLIRSAEVLAGLDVVLSRRGQSRLTPSLLAGPGKVGQALALSSDLNHQSLFRKGELELRLGAQPSSLSAGPRVGIAFASPEDQARPWRWTISDSLAVSSPRLRPY